jgi:hypothetical protein
MEDAQLEKLDYRDVNFQSPLAFSPAIEAKAMLGLVIGRNVEEVRKGILVSERERQDLERFLIPSEVLAVERMRERCVAEFDKLLVDQQIMREVRRAHHAITRRYQAKIAATRAARERRYERALNGPVP